MSDDGGAFTDFINSDDSTDSASGYTIVDTANPVNWGRLGQSVLLSIVATVSLGIQQGVTNASETFVTVLDGASSFIGSAQLVDGFGFGGSAWVGDGLIGTLFVPILNAYREDLWAASIDQFGWAGYPVAMGVTLLFIFIAVRSLQEAGKRLVGGS